MSGLDDMFNRYNEMNIVSRIVIGCCAVWIILMILSLIGHMVLGVPLDSFTEDTATRYKDFAQLDANGDGGLSFDEVRSYDHSSKYSISQSDLYEMFRRCDKNDNGLLIGGEYDSYVAQVKGFINDLESKEKRAQREAQEKAKSSSSSSSSSNSNPFALRSGSSSDGDGAETCPYCGSEAIYESGGVYKCGECGSTIYNPDDLNLNYEEGYYELTLPSFYYSMNLI
jgi:hypothetical protein